MLKANLRVDCATKSIRPPVHGTDTMHAPAMSAKSPPSQRLPQPGASVPEFRHEPVLLDDVLAGTVQDSELAIRKELLEILYPTVVQPNEIGEYLGSDRNVSLVSYGIFISHRLLELTPENDLPTLATSLMVNTDHQNLYLRPCWCPQQLH